MASYSEKILSGKKFKQKFGIYQGGAVSREVSGSYKREETKKIWKPSQGWSDPNE